MGRGSKKKGEATLTQVMARLLEKELVPDLKERARMPGVEPALRQRWEKEKAARRTADPYELWAGHVAEQVGAAWILSIAFIRTLEDRDLLDRRRLAGHEAFDSEHGFFQLFPALGPRDYLLTVFRELSRLPGAEDLLGPRHNPAWRLAPSNAVAQKLLDAWRKDDEVRTPLWTFDGTDTRFLGDLYQDLSQDARERFALLQTPEFVERFILKLTLEPAVAEFGLDEVRLIDPTCGSGHFLLGAYDRLFDLRLAREPGLDRRAHAIAAFAQVNGVDLNPYAVAIARFRLTLAFLEKSGITRLKDAPRLPLNLAVADSLLVAPQEATHHLASLAEDKAGWGFELFDFEDEREARRILSQGHHAVVGNPPYITCKDAVLRDEYRKLYRSCYREYALAAPFTERFFQLAVEGGFVGLINANSFMKREFGKRLIEDVLPNLNLMHVIDTSGAFIPGHGTPTVILIGRNRFPQGSEVDALLGKRGEPSTPDDPEKGLVWCTIAEHCGEVGFENDYASVARVARATLAKHPWSLGGGGAAALKEALERSASRRLEAVVDEIGFVCMTRADDIYFVPRRALRAAGIADQYIVQNVEGEVVRDWAISDPNTTLFPYDASLAPVPFHDAPEVHRFLWPHRTSLWLRREPNGNHREIGLTWWEWSRFQRDRFRCPLLIAFAFVATHNHFVLDRGGKVFKQSAPIIKLPDGATEDEHLALLGYLNSSTACFWMKQVCHKKSSASQKHHTDPARAAYEFAGTALENLPVPDLSGAPVEAVRELLALGEAQAAHVAGTNLAAGVSRSRRPEDVEDLLRQEWRAFDSRRERALYLQEEIDWWVYAAFQLCSQAQADVRLPPSSPVGLGAQRGARPFERAGGYDPGLSNRIRAQGHQLVDSEQPDHWRGREGLLSLDGIRLVESREFKRQWRDSELNEDPAEFRQSLDQFHLKEWVSDLVERVCSHRNQPTSVRTVAEMLGKSPESGELQAVADFLKLDIEELAGACIRESAVPDVSAQRFAASGMEKRAFWERTWDLQRCEDAGEKLAEPIPVPPKYDQKDYRDTAYWRLRGKLDVPKERFISYPGAERDDDKSPIIGWAGWDHLQRAQAFAALYQERKNDAWTKERLAPLLAGLLELVPWLKQWHNEPDPNFGGQRLGDYFAQYVESEARENGLTLDDLRAWRPQAKGKGKKK